MGIQVKQADVFFRKAVSTTSRPGRTAADLYDKAYQDATRALRPLRVIMRDHWLQATATLDTPTASPYAVSFFTLPKHWELFAEVQRSRPGANALPHGSFEVNGAVPAAGLPVNVVPGWSARFGTIDKVDVAAGIVPAARLAEKLQPKKGPEPVKGVFAPGRVVAAADEGYVPPTPELGKSALRLEVRQRIELDRNGKPREESKSPLEKTFLAVDSTPVRFAPGTLVRVSGWIRVPNDITGSADGVLFYDDAGGEPLGVRVSHLPHWKQFHLYRRVPARRADVGHAGPHRRRRSLLRRHPHRAARRVGTPRQRRRLSQRLPDERGEEVTGRGQSLPRRRLDCLDRGGSGCGQGGVVVGE